MGIAVREYIERGWKFGLVGAGGFLVNQGGLMLLVGVLDVSTWLAGLIAIEVSIIANWFLNDLWTWRDRRTSPWITRMLKYNLAAGLTAFGVNYPVLILLSEKIAINYAIANVIGIALAAAANFLINHHWTYRDREIE